MASYYVYKLRIVNTGYFYFGITTNLERRRTAHFRQINSSVNKLIRIPSAKRIALTGYDAVAKKFVHGKRSMNNKDCFKKELCIMSVLYEVDNAKDAAIQETTLIKKNKRNPNCFNTEKESRYYVR